MSTSHTWNFFRAGGFDQVRLDSGADLLALKELDQKLWVALGCPTRGLEFDTRTLDLIDSDADGHVRANEVLAAIEWTGRLLKNADLLVEGADSLALADIDDRSEEGKQVLASARHILRSLGKPDAAAISLADMADIEKFVAGLEFNGDGVICAGRIDDVGLRATVEDIIKCAGSVADLSGAAGVNRDIAGRFFAEAAAYAAWQAKGDGDAAILLLGEKTTAAAEAFHAVRDKVSDYFTRCQLAAYDARAAVPLSRSAEDYQRLAAQNLSAQSQGVANFPLATVEADKPLPLVSGINPAWQDKLDALRERVVMPLLGNKKDLSAQDWAALCARFAAFDDWQAEKPAGSAGQLRFAAIPRIPGRGIPAAPREDPAGEKPGWGGFSAGDGGGGKAAAIGFRHQPGLARQAGCIARAGRGAVTRQQGKPERARLGCAVRQVCGIRCLAGGKTGRQRRATRHRAPARDPRRRTPGGARRFDGAG